MKVITLILLFASCSHNSSGPAWVSSLRSGEERFKLHHGNSILFRRIESTCDLAIAKAKEDIKAEWPQFEKVAHSLEVVYYDKNAQDCAVTLSVPIPVRAVGLSRSELIEKHARYGLKLPEFERLIKERVEVEWDYRNACWKAFYQSGASYHDSIAVCWNFGHIVGYCNQSRCVTRHLGQ